MAFAPQWLMLTDIASLTFEVRTMQLEDVEAVAALHMAVSPGCFLTSLGRPFLTAYYRNYVDRLYAPGLVAVNNERVCGFVAGTTNSLRFWVNFCLGNSPVLLLNLGRMYIIRPGLRSRLDLLTRRAVLSVMSRIGIDSDATSSHFISSHRARLLAIGVAPDMQRHGLGKRLVDGFCRQCYQMGIDTVGVSVLRGNEEAISFYRETGWLPEGMSPGGMYFWHSTWGGMNETGERESQRIKSVYSSRFDQSRLSGLYTLFSPASLFSLQSRQRASIQCLRNAGHMSLKGLRVLDVGCGSGGDLRFLLALGAEPCDLYGVDLLSDRLSSARHLSPHLGWTQGNAVRLPFAEASFDLVTQSTLCSSVLDRALKQQIAFEMLRVLKRDGLILWYDFWLNPTNPQTHGIRPREIRQLFPGCNYEFHRVTLAPPIARRLASHSWLLCSVLERLRVFNTHYLVAIRPV